MLFDKLAKVVDKYYPELKDKVNRSKLFLIDVMDFFQERTPTSTEFQDMGWVLAPELLPFPLVAIESERYLVIVEPTGEFICFSAADDKGYIIFAGERTPQSNSTEIHFQIHDGFDLKCKRVVRDLDVEAEIRPGIKLGGSADTMLRLVIYILQKIADMDDFIVECEPVKKPTGKKKIITRSDKRSQFIILTANKYKTSLNESRAIKGEDQVKLRAGGDRRAHWRTYTSDRYKEMKGKRQRIAATWVGPSSYTTNGRIYKVRLDL